MILSPLFKTQKLTRTFLFVFALLQHDLAFCFDHYFQHQDVVVTTMYEELHYGTVPEFKLFNKNILRKVDYLKLPKGWYGDYDFRLKLETYHKRWGLQFPDIMGNGKVRNERDDGFDTTLALEEGDYYNFYMTSRGAEIGTFSAKEMAAKFPLLGGVDLTYNQIFAIMYYPSKDYPFRNWDQYSRNYDFDVLETKQRRAYRLHISGSPGEPEQEKCAEEQWKKILEQKILDSDSEWRKKTVYRHNKVNFDLEYVRIQLLDARDLPEDVIVPAATVSYETSGEDLEVTFFPVLDRTSCKIVFVE